MKVWLVFEVYSDGCSFHSENVVSVHMSEEGAFLDKEELVRCQSLPYPERDPDRGVGVLIREFEIKP